MAIGYVEIGRVLRPQGNKGEVRILSEANSPQAFLSLLAKGVFLSRPLRPEPQSIEVENSWLHKGFVIVKFKGIDDIGAAGAIRGASLLIAEDDRNTLPEGEFYLDQLIGLTVRDDSNGRRIGTVKDVIKLAGNDLLEVSTDAGRDFLVPFVGAVIRTIDLEKGIMTVSLPEGLEDL